MHIVTNWTKSKILGYGETYDAAIARVMEPGVSLAGLQAFPASEILKNKILDGMQNPGTGWGVKDGVAVCDSEI